MAEQGIAELVRGLKRAENPFDSDKVLRARDSVIDISEIHQTEFNRLRGELERVKNSRRSRGLLVTGVAGSGKSHLVARLYSERPAEVLFFQVQALPGGTAWLKHILQCIVSDLGQQTRHDDHKPQLNILIKHFMDGVRNKIGQSTTSGYSLPELDGALEARQRQIQNTIPDPSVKDVLSVLVNLWKWQAPFGKAQSVGQTRYKTDLAIQWLKGMMIDDEDLSEIGVRANLGADEETGQVTYLNVLRLFGHLTSGRAPIILYFDQLDTMETETINSLGDQLLHLIGSDSAAPNYLVVTAGVREEISKFRTEGIIKQAVADVIFHTELELPALTMDQCLKIVERRLEPVFSSMARCELPDHADALFPFTRAFLECKLKGPIKPSPRQVLKIAGSTFDEIIPRVAPDWLQGWPNVPPLTIEDVQKEPPSRQQIGQFLLRELDKKISARLRQPVTTVVDADLLAETIRRLVKTCSKNAQFKVADLPKINKNKKPTESFFGLTVDGSGDILAGIVINNHNHAGSMKASLNKSLEFLSKFDDTHRILLGRDGQSKSINKWPSCIKPLKDLEATNRFSRNSFEASEIATLLGLDEVRKEVVDLIIPPSENYAQYQVTPEDFSRFLVGTDRLLELPFFESVRSLLSKEKIHRPSPTPSSPAESFVRARVEAKCILAFKALVTEWANHNGRVNPTKGDLEEIDQVTQVLLSKGLIVSLGDGQNRILKKP